MTSEQIEKRKETFRQKRVAAVRKAYMEFVSAPWLAKWAEESEENRELYDRATGLYGSEYPLEMTACAAECFNAYLKDRLDGKTYRREIRSAENVDEFVSEMFSAMEFSESYIMLGLSNDLLDSEAVEFDGDIVITDPYFFIKNDDDLEAYCSDHKLDRFGFEHYMERDTIFGDWECFVKDTDADKYIGEFRAETGRVSVTLLDEVMKYNPDFNSVIDVSPLACSTKDQSDSGEAEAAAVIYDFKGTVRFVVREYSFEYKGKNIIDHRVEVVGHGINKVTGKPLNFVGTVFFENEDDVRWTA